MDPFKKELQIGVICVYKKGIGKAVWRVCLGCTEFRGKLLTNPPIDKSILSVVTTKYHHNICITHTSILQSLVFSCQKNFHSMCQLKY